MQLQEFIQKNHKNMANYENLSKSFKDTKKENKILKIELEKIHE